MWQLCSQKYHMSIIPGYANRVGVYNPAEKILFQNWSHFLFNQFFAIFVTILTTHSFANTGNGMLEIFKLTPFSHGK